MRILVAGGAGFIGSNLSRRLLYDGHEVVAVDNLLTGSLENIADLRLSRHFEFVHADVAELALIEVDVVLHLASPASPVDYDRHPLETLDVNSRGTRRLLEIARHSGARFVLASTSEVYGDPLVHPQDESYWGNVDPIGPRSCYDEGKRFAEALVTSYRRVHGVRAAIVRIFNTYGPSMRRHDGRVVPELLGAALEDRPLTVHGDGAQSRSFMYVTDLVNAFVALVDDEFLDGAILNVGNPEEVTVRQLAETIVRLTGSQSTIVDVPGRDGDPQRRRPNIDRIQARYGWRPTVSLEDGLVRTIHWLTAEPSTEAEPAALELAFDAPEAAAVGGRIS
jgi:nucleoside-diphosphate-sugar epimerase